MKPAITLFVFALFVCPVQQPTGTPQEPPRIRADVSLVTLTATVFGRNDRPVPNLEKNDFVIYEGGVQEEVAFFQKEENPVSVGILFDTSGSMLDKIDEVRDAVIHFINTTNPEDDIFVIHFSSEAFLVQDFTSDRRTPARAIGNLQARGSTVLYEAVVKGLEHIREGQHKKKALLIITDGNDTASQIRMEQAVDFAIRSEVLIYCLGIGHGEHGSFGHLEGLFKDAVDVDVLRTFSNLTGGRTLLVQGLHHKRSVDQIDEACQAVSTELRQQYTLGYYPQNKARDGKYRRIRLQIKNGNYKVRTKDGYFTTPATTLAK